MKKGVILEINETFVTLLTPDGEFLRARKLDIPYSLGEEISFFPVVEEKQEKSIWSLKKGFVFKMTAAITAATIFAMSFNNPFSKQTQVYAYMSIDVNPSIELGVNKDMEVIELKGFNKEGKEIVSELRDWKNRDAVKVTETLLHEIKEDGYFNKSPEILITTVATDGKDHKAATEMKKEVSKIAASVNDEQLKLTVVEATKQERKKAQQLGITAGKYKSIKKAEQKTKAPADAIEKSSTPKVVPPKVDQPEKQKSPDLKIKKNQPKEAKPKKQNKTNSLPPGKSKEAHKKAIDPKKAKPNKPTKEKIKERSIKKPVKVVKKSEIKPNKLENKQKKIIKKPNSQSKDKVKHVRANGKKLQKEKNHVIKHDNKNRDKEKKGKSGH